MGLPVFYVPEESFFTGVDTSKIKTIVPENNEKSLYLKKCDNI